MLHRSSVRFLLLTAGLLLAPPVFGQGVEIEPNGTCAAPQELGAVALPFTLEGELEPAPDVDFYAVEVPPGTWIQIDLQGEGSGAGTLPVPMLAALDSACELLAAHAYDNGTDARMVIQGPADGRLVIAATEYWDYDLVGGGPGSYRLTVSDYPAVGSVGGRLVDADTGEPLGSSYGWTYLLRCLDESCDLYDYVAWSYLGGDGRFVFTTNFWGVPLKPGRYRLWAYVYGYEELTTPPFEAFAGQDLDLGDVAVVPHRLIGSVRGRVVDGIDGFPLSGWDPPWASVHLERCEDSYCYFADWASVDDQGRFVFTPDWSLLFPGTYRLSVWANQYVPTTTPTFSVAEGEHLDLGDIGIDPLPLQIVEKTGCSHLPATGGECRFSISVRNSSRGRLRGAVWSTVAAWGTNPLYTSSTFQVGKVGTTNPQPQPFNLAAGQTSTFDFAFPVPATVQNGAYFCTTAHVGKDPTPHLDVQGSAYLFCVAKYDGALTVMSEKEGRKKLRELEGRGRS